MVPWADADSAAAPAPEEVRREGHQRAGLRCAKLVRQQDKTIPIVLYTILRKADLQDELSGDLDDVVLLTKDPDLGPITEHIRTLMAKTGHA